MKKTYEESKINDLKNRADKRKNNPDYRHIPNNFDIAAANEHAKLLEQEQYRVLSLTQEGV